MRATPVVTGADWLRAERTLSRVAELGRRHDVTFVLENLNTEVDHPEVPFARAADTLALVAAVNDPHLRLNLDLYHAQIGEGNLVDLLHRAAPYIGEVQIADVPGRCEPGTGEVRWTHIAHELAQTGYDGVVALESWSSDPKPSAPTAHSRPSATPFRPWPDPALEAGRTHNSSSSHERHDYRWTLGHARATRMDLSGAMAGRQRRTSPLSPRLRKQERPSQSL